MCDNENVITIPKDRYEELVLSEAILDALYAMGVDSWSGYDEAMSDYRRTRDANANG